MPPRPPQNVINSLGVQNGQILSYPEDIYDTPYACVLRFSKYSRDISLNEGQNVSTATIVLPLPQQLEETQGIDHGDRKFPILGLLVAGARARQEGRSFAEIFADPAIAGAAASVFGSAIQQAGGITGLAGAAVAGIGDLIGSTTGVLLNPHATLLFTGVPLREFSYSWSLSPRSSGDANTIRSILNLIRKKSLPSLRNDGISLNYPEEVQVDFVGNGIEKFVFGTKRTVITSFTLNNSAEGYPMFYKDGAPVSINFSITLKEIAIRTSDDYQDPFESVTYQP